MMELDPEPAHPLQVSFLARGLFDELVELHSLGEPERNVLAAAGLLHDIGWSVGWSRHHKNSRDLIMKNALEGWSGRETAMVALVARYHRKGHPSDRHRLYRDLAPEDRSTVRKLAALIRIADGFDRSHSASVRKISCITTPGEVRGEIYTIRPIDSELSVLERKASLFREVYAIPFVVDKIVSV